MAATKCDVVLQAEVDIRSVQQLKDQLVAVLAKSRKKAIAVDAGAVERVDAAALQLLAAFVAAAKEHQRPVAWQSPSAAFAKAAADLGLTGPLVLA